MSKPVIIIGAGGHGKVVADALLAMGRTVRGFVDANPALWESAVNGVPVLRSDATLTMSDAENVELANGIGSVRSLQLRQTTYERFRAMGFRFVTIVHPRSVVSPSAGLQEGAQVMAGAIVQPDTVIGENTIINTGAIVDHDCRIGAHCHVAPGCTISGGVIIGDASHVGTGASIKQGVRLGSATVVGAGAAVIFDHQGGATLIGVPARSGT